MKMPKIKAIKLTRRQKQHVAQIASVIVYSFAAAVYGTLNYVEGTEVGAEGTWNAATDAADMNGSVWIEHRDKEYVLVGSDSAKELREAHDSEETDAEE